MSPSPKSILITGASGFIGSHVVHQALEAGYSVRATARPGKVDALKAKFSGKIEVVAFAGFIKGDYTDALKDVHAILHLASPLPWTANAEDLLEGAVGGALNILRQGAAMGIKRAVITSSFVAVADVETDEVYSDKVFTENDWYPGTREEVLEGNRSATFSYSAAKTIGLEVAETTSLERELTSCDLSGVNPTFVYGPFVPGSLLPRGDIASMSSVGTVFYKSILPDDPSFVTWTMGGQNANAQSIDVRDLARAHILALNAPLTAQVGRKRILLSGPAYTWYDAVKYLRATRPDLSSRLANIQEGGERMKIATLDISKAKDVLGLGGFIDWKKTVDDRELHP